MEEKSGMKISFTAEEKEAEELIIHNYAFHLSIFFKACARDIGRDYDIGVCRAGREELKKFLEELIKMQYYTEEALSLLSGLDEAIQKENDQ